MLLGLSSPEGMLLSWTFVVQCDLTSTAFKESLGTSIVANFNAAFDPPSFVDPGLESWFWRGFNPKVSDILACSNNYINLPNRCSSSIEEGLPVFCGPQVFSLSCHYLGFGNRVRLRFLTLLVNFLGELFKESHSFVVEGLWEEALECSQ